MIVMDGTIDKLINYETCGIPYASAEDVDSDGEDNLFFDMIKPNIKPLCVGYIIRYNPLFDKGNTGKEKEGTVENVDKREKKITTSNIDVSVWSS